MIYKQLNLLPSTGTEKLHTPGIGTAQPLVRVLVLPHKAVKGQDEECVYGQKKTKTAMLAFSGEPLVVTP